MKKHRRWWILAVFVIAVAAAVAGGVLWFGRSKTTPVRYLTATAATGTISDTVQADFTLAAAQGTTTIALGGSSASGSSTTGSATSTTSTSSTSSTTTSLTTTGGALTTYVAIVASDTPTPTPTPSATATGTPT
ncbi:MAG TPA: hypothetical protein VFD50_03540, partial [Thermoleophilia bacterium]|nr:hypothetical protein [Thermoleophilia bacterium]